MELIGLILTFQFGNDIVVKEGPQEGSLPETLFTGHEDRETGSLFSVTILILKGESEKQNQ